MCVNKAKATVVDTSTLLFLAISLIEHDSITSGFYQSWVAGPWCQELRWNFPMLWSDRGCPGQEPHRFPASSIYESTGVESAKDPK